MNVIVTGATGFIGHHLCKKLTDDNFYVKELSSISNNVNTRITEYTDWTGTLEGVDVIIHLAGYAHKKYSTTEYNNNDYKPTKNLLNQAGKANVGRFIFISTANVYEGEMFKAINNYNSIVSPKQASSKTKVRVEKEIIKSCSNGEMQFTILRTPLVYGEGVKANFASLMGLVGKGLPLPFRAINNNKRSMVSVYNLVDLIKTCIEHPNAANHVFLASDDNDLSTAEMVALMAKVQGKRNLALPVPVWLFNLAAKLLNKQDVVNRLTGSLQLDIEHTKKTLDWQPPYSVEHGFKLAVKK